MLLFLREKKRLVLYMITLFSIDEFDQIPVRQNQNKCQKSPQPRGLEAFDLLKLIAELCGISYGIRTRVAALKDGILVVLGGIFGTFRGLFGTLWEPM